MIKRAHILKTRGKKTHVRLQDNNMATLFSYFTKTPKKADKAEGSKENKTPPSAAQGVSSTKNGKAGKSAMSTPCGISNSHSKVSTPLQLKCFEVVWAKMEGHPSWPSIICKHPSQDKYLNDKKYHVQFFGEPPSRGWVNLKYVDYLFTYSISSHFSLRVVEHGQYYRIS
jgi:hypothetical protein